MRYAAAGLLFVACLALPPAGAQSTGSDTPAPDQNKAQSKPRRVWDNDDIQSLRGGISVVGNPSSTKPATAKAAAPKKPLPAKPPGLQFEATTIDGDEITNESLKGKTILVQFWTTWCPHCRNDQAAVDRIARSFDSEEVAVLAVDVEESKKKVDQYLKASPRSCPIILSADTTLMSLFANRTFPTYVLIDRDGHIAGTRHGEIGEEGMRKLLSHAGVEAD
ncbi:MAG: TlpA disulfide reductase family protein [Terriglobales bacterium]